MCAPPSRASSFFSAAAGLSLLPPSLPFRARAPALAPHPSLSALPSLLQTAVAGILVPAVSTAAGVPGVPQWYDAPQAITSSASAYPAAANVFVTLLLAGWVENKRWADMENPGSQGDGSFLGVTDPLKGVEPCYPGGAWFDPMGLSRGDKAKYEEYKVKEIKSEWL